MYGKNQGFLKTDHRLLFMLVVSQQSTTTVYYCTSILAVSYRDILLLLLLLLLFCYFANRSLTDHGASLGFEKGCLYWYILGDTGAVSRARSIPGDPGAVSRAELKSATNVFKHGRKSFSAHAWKLSSRLFSRPDWLPLGLRGCRSTGLISGKKRWLMKWTFYMYSV